MFILGCDSPLSDRHRLHDLHPVPHLICPREFKHYLMYWLLALQLNQEPHSELEEGPYLTTLGLPLLAARVASLPTLLGL